MIYLNNIFSHELPDVDISDLNLDEASLRMLAMMQLRYTLNQHRKRRDGYNPNNKTILIGTKRQRKKDVVNAIVSGLGTSLAIVDVRRIVDEERWSWAETLRRVFLSIQDLPGVYFFIGLDELSETEMVAVKCHVTLDQSSSLIFFDVEDERGLLGPLPHPFDTKICYSEHTRTEPIELIEYRVSQY